MKNLVHAALLLVGLAQASGCRVVACCDSAGQFELTSTISTADGRALDCTAADADTVVLISTAANGGPSFTETFPCDDMGATTGDLPLGLYTVEVWLGKDTGEVDDFGDSIIEQRSTDVLTVADEVLRRSNDVISLGNFDFRAAISGDGGFSIHRGDPVGEDTTRLLPAMEQLPVEPDTRTLEEYNPGFQLGHEVAEQARKQPLGRSSE